MEEPPASAQVRRQQLRSRIFWFLAGAVLNYLLISTPFKWLRANTDLSVWVIAPCSLAVSATFFFSWNYFVNFRTDSRKRDALARYVTAVCLMWLLSSTLLALLKQFNAHYSFNVGAIPLDLDIVATQFFLAWLKFLLYHKWVFPLPKEETPLRAGDASVTHAAHRSAADRSSSAAPHLLPESLVAGDSAPAAASRIPRAG